MAKPFYSDTQVIQSLTNTGGAVWSGANITYKFPSSYALNSWEGAGFSRANAAQQESSNYWMRAWDEVIGRSIVQVGATQQANITVANTTYSSYAHAYYPGEGSLGGSVWLNGQYGNWAGTGNLATP